MGFEDETLKFLLMNKNEEKFIVLLKCDEAEFKTYYSNKNLNEEELFINILINLIGCDVRAERPFDNAERWEVLKGLLAYFFENNYLKQQDDIENAILHHMGNELGFQKGDHETRTPRVNITGDEILKGIDFILDIHADYYHLHDSVEYHKMINQAIWKALLYMTDIMMYKGVYKSRMVDNYHQGNEVTRECLLDIIADELNFFDPKQIKQNLHCLEISPNLKKSEFKSVIVPINDPNIDPTIAYILTRIGTPNLFKFQLTVSLTYRNYLIRKGMASNQAISKMQHEFVSLFYKVIDQSDNNSFEILDGLYKIKVLRDQMTNHIHFDVTFDDEVLESIEKSTVFAC